MDCPICGSDDVEILNSKQKSSKKKIMEEYLLRCESCGHVFKDMFSVKKPIPYRLIISEQDKSHKTTIDLSPSDELKVGGVLLSDLGQVEVTSIEVNDKRLKKSKIEDISTIWASPGDVVKIENHIVKVHVIKTQERKLTSGFAKAGVIRRVYSKPVKFHNFDYDLTKYIFKKTIRE